MSVVFHGSPVIVDQPKLRKQSFQHAKDFSWGFYCTRLKQQTREWAKRNLGHDGASYINIYKLNDDKVVALGDKYKKFTVHPIPERRFHDKNSNEWLDFTIQCRLATNTDKPCHPFYIVEGPMLDGKLPKCVDDYANGRITRKSFWKSAMFSMPTNQISFHNRCVLDKDNDFISFIKAEYATKPIANMTAKLAKKQSIRESFILNFAEGYSDMKGMRLTHEEKFRIDYFCGLIEFIARTVKLHRSAVIDFFDDNDIAWQLQVACVNSNLWIDQVAEELIDYLDIEQGDHYYNQTVCDLFDFDTVGDILKTCAVALIEQKGMSPETAIRKVLKTPLNQFLQDIG